MTDMFGDKGIIELKCTNCGGSFDEFAQDSEYVTCSFCGNTQKLLDAKEYYDQITGQIHQWIKKLIPSGIDISRVENVDFVSRHHIFINNIQPHLDSIYSNYNLNLHSLLNQPLLILPFMGNREVNCKYNSKELFEFNAKINSIRPIAIGDEDCQYIDEIDSISDTFAHLLNTISLMQDIKIERYEFMATNFSTVSQILKDKPDHTPLFSRFIGLSEINHGTFLFLSGKTQEALEYIQKGNDSLNKCLELSNSVPSYATTRQAVKKELTISGIIEKMILSAEQDPSGQPLDTVLIIERIVSELVNQEQFDSGYWQGTFKDYKRYEEIFTRVADIRLAQNGEAKIKVCKGAGSCLYPFWAVDLPYSFKTGLSIMAKGKQANETLLVSASFPLVPDSLSSNPSSVLTDVFVKDPSKGIFSGVKASVLGNETSISSADNRIQRIADSASYQSIGGKKVIPPLSSKSQAVKLVSLYINKTLEMNKSIDKKFRLSSPNVIDLVYIPGESFGSRIRLNLDVEPFTPKNVGDGNHIHNLAL